MKVSSDSSPKVEKILKRKISTKVVSGCICCATQVPCRRAATKLVGEVIFAVWVLKLLSSQQPLTAHSSQLSLFHVHKLCNQTLVVLEQVRRCSLLPGGVRLSSKGALHPSVPSMGLISCTCPQRCHHSPDSQRSLPSCSAGEWQYF